jgi:gluconolactonase
MTTRHWDTASAMPSTSLMEIDDFAPFVEGLDHPEGVACGPNGELYAGGEAGQIYRVSLDGSFDQIGTTGGFVLGLCLDANQNVYACDLAQHAVYKVTPDGEAQLYSSGTSERAMVSPNYPVFDANGNLYVSDSGDWKAHNGCIHVIRPDGTTEIFTSELNAFPNGLALHPSGKYLYAVVSQTASVARVEITADGKAGSIETMAEMPRNVPDGIAFDADENLYIACYTPDVIYRLTPEGHFDVLASDWESVTFATPTNIAFCGSDLKTLVVASLSRWHLTKGQMPIAGARLNYPAL